MKVKIAKFDNADNPVWVIGFTELPPPAPAFFINLDKEAMRELEKAILEAGYNNNRES